MFKQFVKQCTQMLATVGVVTALLLSSAASATPVQAHGEFGAFAQFLVPGRTAPVVDGYCRLEEYAANADLRSLILYRPRFNADAATMRMVATATDLYLCLGLLPLGSSSTIPFVSVAFDPRHNGGSVPDSDDIVLNVTQRGELSSVRGDGTGAFTPDPSITGWAAAAGDGIDGLSWSAEYRIPLSFIGGGASYTSIGFHVRHNWLNAVGDDYAWPYNGGWNVPNSWGHLWWLPAPTTALPALLDVVRITQGLEFDPFSTSSYVLIAGKDTLVRSQLYTFGTQREIVYSRCLIQQQTSLVGNSVLPQLGPEQSVVPNFGPGSQVNFVPFRFFNGSPVLNCWAPGVQVAAPGDYRFQIEIQLAGGARQRIDLGTRRFYPTGDLRVMLYRYTGWPPPPNDAIWDSAHTLGAQEAMYEFQRRFPLRAGVGALNRTGVAHTPATLGLRYFIHPTIGACDLTRESQMECGLRSRQTPELARRAFNAEMARLDAIDRRQRDRLDWGMVLYAARATMGGQSCWFDYGHRVAGGDADALAQSGTATIIAHELAHCMGEAHSTPWDIPLYQRLPLVNLRTRMDMPGAVNLMNPSVANVYNTFPMGDMWKRMRETLLTMERPTLASVSAAGAADQPLFRLVGAINQTDLVTVSSSMRVDGLPLELTPVDPQGSFALSFRDAQGIELGRYGFTPVFDDPDTGQNQEAPLFLITPLPDGSISVVIEKQGQRLYSQDFTVGKPNVAAVTAISDGKQMSMTWQASDPESDGKANSLTFDVSFIASPGEAPLLLAAGLTEKHYHFSLNLMPATEQGQLIVTASDGYNSSQAVSNLVVITPQPPLASISAPLSNQRVVAAQPLILLGLGYDPTTGPLHAAALTWHSDRDGDLGSGEQVTTQLSSGVHTLTLKVTAPSGLSATTSIQVEVDRDSDNDGLTDNYEAQYACLAVATFDSNGDPDGDRLASLGEQQQGTHPCEVDSDQDGIGDGDEVQAGSDPTNVEHQPLNTLLTIHADEIDLGVCPQSATKNIDIEVSPPERAWRVLSDSAWLQVNGGGVGNGTVTIHGDCTGLGKGAYHSQVLIGTTDGVLRLLNVQLVADDALTSSTRVFLPLVTK